MPKLFRTDISSEADVKVFVTDVRSEADVIVFETTSEWDATGSAMWFYTEVRTEADKAVYFADSPWDADLIAYKTDIQSNARWVKLEKSDIL